MAEMRQWHCMVNGQQYGPVGEAEFRTWIANGRVGANDMVWTDGMSRWQPLREVQHMFADGAPPITPGSALPAYGPHRGTAVLVLGIVGLCIPFFGIPGAIAWYMGNEELRRMDAGLADPAGRSMVTAGRICGIIGFCLGILGCCFMGLWLTMVFGMAGAHGF